MIAVVLLGLAVLAAVLAVLSRWLISPEPEQPRNVQPRRRRPSFSVLIPVDGKDESVRTRLKQIATWRYPRHLVELIVIARPDDRDAAAGIEEISGEDWADHVRLVTLSAADVTRAEALNAGLKVARNEIAVALSPDRELPPGILLDVGEALENGTIDAVQCEIDRWPQRGGALSAALEYAVRPSLAHFGFPSDRGMPLHERVLFVRRESLERLGGWDDVTSSEDADLAFRLRLAGARVQAVRHRDATDQQPAPAILGSAVSRVTRWNLDLLRLWERGEWRLFPRIDQRAVAGYSLMYPSVHAVFSLTAPFALLALSFFPVPAASAFAWLSTLLLYAPVTAIGVSLVAYLYRSYHEPTSRSALARVASLVPLALAYVVFHWLVGVQTLQALADYGFGRASSDRLPTRSWRVLPTAVLTDRAMSSADVAASWQAFLERRGQSARNLLGRRAKAAAVGALLVVAVLLVANPLATTIAFVAAVTVVYLATTVYKAVLLSRAVGAEKTGLVVDRAEVDALDESALPTYTILVPLYKEAEVLPELVEGLARLDYPADKLDVKLLLEADDDVTLEAVRRTELPPWIDPVVVPQGEPKTKPRACNHGLATARGDYLVIYDAEDRPEPDQLKKAVAAFDRVEEDVVCLQAKLNYYNPRQNLLTRLFAIEYSTWFDLLLPGLHASASPIPLGGTSNHFRTEALRRLGGWDAFNVAEDCDLGTRIYATGHRVEVLDSTTWEEANSDVGNWIRQRSRWVKGYIQTYFVHTRHSPDLIRRLGLGGFAAFQLFVGGTALTLLLNPVLWLLTLAYFATRSAAIEAIFPAPVYYVGMLNLMVGNFLFTYVNLFGPIQRREHDLAKYGLLMPAYWVIMSVAAWKGALQLITRPHFWEKTHHGLWVEGEAK